MSHSRALILIVDDEFRQIYPIAEELTNQGYDVHCEMNRTDAEEWLQESLKEQRIPDLIICDLMMFQYKGQPLAEAREAGLGLIAGLPALIKLKTRLIILTGVSLPETREKAKQLVEDRWVLYKPVSTEVVVERVKAALNLRRFAS